MCKPNPCSRGFEGCSVLWCPLVSGYPNINLKGLGLGSGAKTLELDVPGYVLRLCGPSSTVQVETLARPQRTPDAFSGLTGRAHSPCTSYWSAESLPGNVASFLNSVTMSSHSSVHWTESTLLQSFAGHSNLSIYRLNKSTVDSCEFQAFPLLFLCVVTPSKLCLKIKPEIMYQDFDLEVADSFTVQLKKSQRKYEKGLVLSLLGAGTRACESNNIISSATSYTSPETTSNHCVALTRIV